MAGKRPDRVVREPEARAERSDRSLRAKPATKERAEFLKAADAMRARLAGRHHTETLELLRADRDR